MNFLRAAVLIFLCSGCGSTFLMVKKLKVDKTALASTFARTPDPLQADPPTGEKLYVAWWLPFRSDYSQHKLVLHVIYKDLSEETITKRLPRRVGTFEHALIGKAFTSKKGIFSYKVDLIDEKEQIVDTWEHIMWVKVLK